MNYKKTHIILGTILLAGSLYLVISGILVNRMEFSLVGFVGAFGVGECCKRIKLNNGKE